MADVHRRIAAAEAALQREHYSDARAFVTGLDKVDDRALRILGSVDCARNDCEGTRRRYQQMRSASEREKLINFCMSFTGIELITCSDSLQDLSR